MGKGTFVSLQPCNGSPQAFSSGAQAQLPAIYTSSTILNITAVCVEMAFLQPLSLVFWVEQEKAALGGRALSF